MDQKTTEISQTPVAEDQEKDSRFSLTRGSADVAVLERSTLS